MLTFISNSFQSTVRVEPFPVVYLNYLFRGSSPRLWLEEPSDSGDDCFFMGPGGHKRGLAFEFMYMSWEWCWAGSF